MTDYNEKILEADFIEVETLMCHVTKEWSERDPAKLRGMCVHQSLEEYGTASGNAKYHSGPNHISDEGLPGLAYTFFIEKDGRIIFANSVEKKTWSQGSADANELYIGVCVGGNFSGAGYEGTQEPTIRQKVSVGMLWDHLKRIWNWGDDCLFGHYHFGKKACPGDDLQEYVQEIRPRTFTTIVERQKVLSTLGFYRGAQDGKWGPQSKGALCAFEKSAGLEPDGVWDDKVSERVKARLGM